MGGGGGEGLLMFSYYCNSEVIDVSLFINVQLLMNCYIIIMSML